MNVLLPIDFRDAYTFGRDLHCCTADVYRDGVWADCFPVRQLQGGTGSQASGLVY
nr:hypothetical protein [Gymnodinialimonas phycosphaerae]